MHLRARASRANANVACVAVRDVVPRRDPLCTHTLRVSRKQDRENCCQRQTHESSTWRLLFAFHFVPLSLVMRGSDTEASFTQNLSEAHQRKALVLFLQGSRAGSRGGAETRSTEANWRVCGRPQRLRELALPQLQKVLLDRRDLTPGC